MDYVNEFFVGTAHDQNFEFMVNFYEESTNIDLTSNDILAKLKLTNSVSMSEYYKRTKFSDTELSTPPSSSYKEIALD